ncbi:hypothetical protein KI387_036877, partial [Taxus chinensis]
MERRDVGLRWRKDKVEMGSSTDGDVVRGGGTWEEWKAREERRETGQVGRNLRRREGRLDRGE